MTRVPFGVASSPFLLAATLHHHFKALESRYPGTVTQIQDAFYVDDLIVGASTGHGALRLYYESTAILAEASMELRKWASNSSALEQQFLEDGTAYDNEACTTRTMKVLGIIWDRTTDEIILCSQNVKTFLTSQQPTKRSVLQVCSRLFDPLGYLAPFTI